MEHRGKLAGHRVPGEDENPPLLAVQLRLLSLPIKGLRRAPNRIEGSTELSADDTLSIGCGSRLGDKDDVRLRSDELRCLGGNAGHINDNDLAPIRVCGARDGAVLLKVNGRPIESIGRGDWPTLGPGVGKVRREGDEVRGDEGPRDPSLANSAPSYVITVASGGGRKGGESKRGGGDKTEDEEWEEIDNGEEEGERSITERGEPRRARMRGLANAASRVRTVVAGINDDSNPMDNEGPSVLSTPMTAALGEPGGVDSRIFINLTRCGYDSSMESIEGVDDPGTDIKAAGVSDCLNVLPNRLVIPNGEPVSHP